MIDIIGIVMTSAGILLFIFGIIFPSICEGSGNCLTSVGFWVIIPSIFGIGVVLLLQCNLCDTFERRCRLDEE